MAIKLNHTIVPAHDKEASAKFFAHMFGLKYDGAMSHFANQRNTHPGFRQPGSF